MTVEFTDPTDTLRDRAAARLTAAVTLVRDEHRRRLGVPNPPPHTDSSAPGEYPRKRTGNLQAAVEVAVDPVNLTARVGLAAEGEYGDDLVRRGRLGLLDTLKSVRQDVIRVIKGG